MPGGRLVQIDGRRMAVHAAVQHAAACGVAPGQGVVLVLLLLLILGRLLLLLLLVAVLLLRTSGLWPVS